MRERFALWFLAACLVFTSGCALLVVGAGAGAGAYTYASGELIRTYPASFDKTCDSVRQSLNYLKIKIIDETHDGITSTITARRFDGTPIHIRITMLSPKITEVGVRSGLIGYWDREGSELIHATIAQRIR